MKDELVGIVSKRLTSIRSDGMDHSPLSSSVRRMTTFPVP